MSKSFNDPTLLETVTELDEMPIMSSNYDFDFYTLNCYFITCTMYFSYIFLIMGWLGCMFTHIQVRSNKKLGFEFGPLSPFLFRNGQSKKCLYVSWVWPFSFSGDKSVKISKNKKVYNGCVKSDLRWVGTAKVKLVLILTVIILVELKLALRWVEMNKEKLEITSLLVVIENISEH